MAKVINTAPRLILIGGIRCVPTQPTEVSDEALKHPRVAALIAAGVLQVEGTAKAAGAEPGKKAGGKGGE